MKLLLFLVPCALGSCCFAPTLEGEQDGQLGSADGGCAPAWVPPPPLCAGTSAAKELTACTQSADCGGPSDSACASLTCVDDPALGGSVCEFGCATTADCPSLDTVCRNGSCTENFCGPGTTNGSLFGTCTAVCGGDGTCNAIGLADGGLQGVCSQAGSGLCASPVVCSPDAGCVVDGASSTFSPTRATPPAQLCPPGTTCLVLVQQDGGFPSCLLQCDLYAATPICPSGEKCVLEHPLEPPDFVADGVCR